jgi:hypothetical protein
MLTLKVILFMYVLFACNKMKNKEKHHTVGTFPKSNRTIVERGKTVPFSHKYMTSHFSGLLQAFQ